MDSNVEQETNKIAKQKPLFFHIKQEDFPSDRDDIKSKRNNEYSCQPVAPTCELTETKKTLEVNTKKIFTRVINFPSQVLQVGEAMVNVYPVRSRRKIIHNTLKSETEPKTNQIKQRVRKKEKLKYPFSCDQCSYIGKHKSNFFRHRMIHTGERPFACDRCGYSCNVMSNLKAHKLIHTGEKPFSCDECNYSCNQKSQLKTHKFVHSGEKSFACDQCNYTCSRKCRLETHKLIHTGLKPIACDECNFKCNQKSILKRHKYIHTGNKPYNCDKCSYACNRKNSLQKHQLIHAEMRPPLSE